MSGINPDLQYSKQRRETKWTHYRMLGSVETACFTATRYANPNQCVQVSVFNPLSTPHSVSLPLRNIAAARVTLASDLGVIAAVLTDAVGAREMGVILVGGGGRTGALGENGVLKLF